MRIIAKTSFNLDILCFMNALTSDEYYVKRHRGAYDAFYPLLSGEVKEEIRRAAEAMGSTMLSPLLTLAVSSLGRYNERGLAEMLESHAEIEESMNRSQYGLSRDEYDGLFRLCTEAVVPAVSELEKNGFRNYWEREKLPKLSEKCSRINEYTEKYNVEGLIRPYKDIDFGDIVIYICSFAAPHGIKLCGSELISDITYPNETIMANVTHEMFHPPYRSDRAAGAIKSLFEKPWVIEAFQNQDPHSGYSSMDGFIEENIVEALGTYIMYSLGLEKEPYEYFAEHDGGSHVISPYFFKYLLENKKEKDQPFEDYFIRFAETVDGMTIE